MSETTKWSVGPDLDIERLLRPHLKDLRETYGEDFNITNTRSRIDERYQMPKPWYATVGDGETLYTVGVEIVERYNDAVKRINEDRDAVLLVMANYYEVEQWVWVLEMLDSSYVIYSIEISHHHTIALRGVSSYSNPDNANELYYGGYARDHITECYTYIDDNGWDAIGFMISDVNMFSLTSNYTEFVEKVIEEVAQLSMRKFDVTSVGTDSIEVDLINQNYSNVLSRHRSAIEGIIGRKLIVKG